MSNRARIALRGAAAGVALLFVTWFAAFHVGIVERADRSILRGFAGLHRPRIDQITRFVANLCDPHPYVLLAAVPVVVALIRRRPRVAVAVGLIMLGANTTTQLLKPLLATPRSGAFPGPMVGAASWPSGHATAVMALALCAVIAAPARLRPLVGAAMAAFSIAVCYSFLELAWHYPTDVLGGFLVATTWTLLGAAGLSWLEARRPAPRRASDASAGAQVSIAEALAPMSLLVLGALLLAALIALVRPHAVVTYASAHVAFIAGAAGIAALGLVIATGATLALRRG
ncbi:MAG: phosphatase PAP2 family protein [Solirubrobacteraceae bacterium]